MIIVTVLDLLSITDSPERWGKIIFEYTTNIANIPIKLIQRDSYRISVLNRDKSNIANQSNICLQWQFDGYYDNGLLKFPSKGNPYALADYSIPE